MKSKHKNRQSSPKVKKSVEEYAARKLRNKGDKGRAKQWAVIRRAKNKQIQLAIETRKFTYAMDVISILQAKWSIITACIKDIDTALAIIQKLYNDTIVLQHTDCDSPRKTNGRRSCEFWSTSNI